MQVGGYWPQFRSHRGVICLALMPEAEPVQPVGQIRLRCGLVLGSTRCSGINRQADVALTGQSSNP